MLFEFLDNVKDIGCLVYNYNIRGYEPKSREWIKSKIYESLKQQAK